MTALPPRTRDLVAPLGLVFTDGPVGPAEPVGPTVLDGLSVSAWPEGGEGGPVAATINGAGVAGFHRLPGLRFNPADPFAGPTRPFIVEVRDARGRFQTGRVGAAAPLAGTVRVEMRSAPTRTVEPGRVAFRAELWDVGNGRGAAFALVTVRLAGNGGKVVATGLADADGRVLAVGDWPPPKATAPADKPPLWDAPRALLVEIRYDPAAPRDVPRLDRVTAVPARAWHRRGPAPGAADEPFVPPDLTAGRPVVFRSAGDAAGRLLVTSP